MDPIPYEKIFEIMRKFPDFNFNPEEKWAEFITAEPDFRKERIYFRWRDFKQSSQKIRPGTKLAELSFFEVLDNNLQEIYSKVKKMVSDFFNKIQQERK